jgi:type III pantothenate kinase
MLLVIDVGNTETVLGVFDGGGTLSAHWRLSSTIHRTADECRIMLKMWAGEKGLSFADIGGVVISSVVPMLTGIFVDMVNKTFSIEPLIVSWETDTGLDIQIESPNTLGADRICNAVAGMARFGGPLVVVDFGTATTFDVVGENGAYLGGAIVLGLKTAAIELHRVAAMLPKVELVFPAHVIERNTETCMRSGIMWGTVAMIDGMIDKIMEEARWKSARIVGTGGLAAVIKQKSKRIECVEPFLTLEGMRLIHDRVAKQKKQGGKA